MDIKTLKLLLTDAFAQADDIYIEHILDEVSEKNNFEYDEVEDFEWVSNGKYQEGEAILKIIAQETNYYIFVRQCRSGSYHDDYYYVSPALITILTEEQYTAPKTIYEFVYHGQTIVFKNDNQAYIKDTVFESVEKAIDSLLV